MLSTYITARGCASSSSDSGSSSQSNSSSAVTVTGDSSSSSTSNSDSKIDQIRWQVEEEGVISMIQGHRSRLTRLIRGTITQKVPGPSDDQWDQVRLILLIRSIRSIKQV